MGFQIPSCHDNPKGEIMKIKILFVLILVSVVLSGYKQLTSEALKKEGWVKVELSEMADTTWYGFDPKGKGEPDGHLIYIFPNGKKVLYTKNYINKTSPKYRGEFVQYGKNLCVQYDDSLHGHIACYKVWKKGDVYRFIDEMAEFHRFIMKRGNPENIR